MRSLIVAIFTLAILVSGEALGKQPSQHNSRLIEQAITGQLKKGAKDGQGRPVLITAIIHGTADQVEQLIDQGYSPDSTYQGLRAITYTVSDSCHPRKLEALIDGGAKINTSERLSGSYPIHSAVQHSDLSCFNILLKHGAKLNVRDDLGQSPYFHALDFSNEKALHRLWDAGADPTIQANNGLDVFHYAIIAEKTDLVKELLTQYHDANVKR